MRDAIRLLWILFPAAALVASTAAASAAQHVPVGVLAVALTGQIEGAVVVEPSRSSPKGIAARFEEAGLERIDVIHYVCRLSEEQRQKLLLAWRGDLRRMTETITRLKEEQNGIANDQQKAAALELRILEQQLILEQRSIDPNSLFDKVVLATLTPSQAVRYGPIGEVCRAGGQVHLRPKGWNPIVASRVAGRLLADGDLGRVEGMSVELFASTITDEGLARLDGAEFTQLDLFDCNAITDDGLASLKAIPALRLLRLGELNLPALGFPARAEKFRLTDAGLAHIGALTHLEGLLLQSPVFTDEGLRHLKPLVNLRRLLLDVKATDASLAILQGMSKLESLDLRGDWVTDAGLVHLKGLENLESLSLHDAPISDAGLVHLSALQRLESIELDDTKVTREGLLKHLRGLPRLRSVRLNDMALSSEIEQLRKAPPDAGTAP